MISSLSFAWPWLFLALPLPLLVYRLPLVSNVAAEAALRFPFSGMLQQMQATQTRRSSGWLLWLAIVSWCLLVTAAARPQLIGESVQLPVSGRSLMLAVDISGSMEQQDMILARQQVDRLTAVKAVAGEFIEKRTGDFIGLILFGRQAYLQSPLSYDRTTVKTLLYEAAVGLAGQETAIGDAIGLAVKRLREQPQSNRVLILLTDGSNTAGHIDPLRAAELAASQSIRIYTIGVGDDSRLGGLFNLRLRNSDIDEATLQAIAEKTGGRFFRARDIRQLQEIYQVLDEIEPVSDISQQFREIEELYHWPLAASLILVLIPAVFRVAAMRKTAHG